MDLLLEMNIWGNTHVGYIWHDNPETDKPLITNEPTISELFNQLSSQHGWVHCTLWIKITRPTKRKYVIQIEKTQIGGGQIHTCLEEPIQRRFKCGSWYKLFEQPPFMVVLCYLVWDNTLSQVKKKRKKEIMPWSSTNKFSWTSTNKFST